MTDAPESYSQAEIVRLLKGLTNSIGDLRTEVRASSATFVTRAELAAWQTGYDREVKQLRDETKPVKVSPWTVVGVIAASLIGVGSLVASIIINVLP